MSSKEPSRKEIISEIARLLDEEGNAYMVLDNMSYPRGRIKPWSVHNPTTFWDEVYRNLDRGLVPDGIERLHEAVANLFPGNDFFSPWRTRSQPTPPQNRRSASKSSGQNRSRRNEQGINVYIRGYEGNPQELIPHLQLEAEQNRLSEIPLLEFTASDTIVLFIPNTNRANAQRYVDALSKYLSDAQIIIGREDFRDYLLRSIYVQGPDRARYEINNVPASTSINSLSQALISTQYEENTWPRDQNNQQRNVVADRVSRDGQEERIDSKWSMHEGGIQEGDTILLNPPSTAGGGYVIDESIGVSPESYAGGGYSHAQNSSHDMFTKINFRIKKSSKQLEEISEQIQFNLSQLEKRMTDSNDEINEKLDILTFTINHLVKKNEEFESSQVKKKNEFEGLFDLIRVSKEGDEQNMDLDSTLFENGLLPSDHLKVRIKPQVAKVINLIQSNSK